MVYCNSLRLCALRKDRPRRSGFFACTLESIRNDRHSGIGSIWFYMIVWYRPFDRMHFMSFVSKDLRILLIEASEPLVSILRAGRAEADRIWSMGRDFLRGRSVRSAAIDTSRTAATGTIRARRFPGHRNLVGSIKTEGIAYGKPPTFPALKDVAYLRSRTSSKRWRGHSNRLYTGQWGPCSHVAAGLNR